MCSRTLGLVLLQFRPRVSAGSSGVRVRRTRLNLKVEHQSFRVSEVSKMMEGKIEFMAVYQSSSVSEVFKRINIAVVRFPGRVSLTSPCMLRLSLFSRSLLLRCSL